MKHSSRAVVLACAGALIGALATPSSAEACGGFFCNGGGGPSGPTPIVQAAERIIFEKRQDGTVRAYIQIRYDQGGPPIGFSWIIPVLSVPEVGIAEAATFDALDAATAPQFRFISNARPVSGGGGGGGCGASDAATADRGAAGTMMDVDGVMVWQASRVGDYETATISGDTAAQLLQWLERNEYDVPPQAEDLLDEYVREGHLFVAFKYQPLGAGTGSLDPVVLTYEGDKPCVPIRITAIASTPILDIMVLALGDSRAAPDGAFVATEPDYSAIRPDFTAMGQTTYPIEVTRAIEMAGGKAFVTEFADESDSVMSQLAPTASSNGVIDREAQALLSRNAYVTRFYTRIASDDMDVDPEFVYPGGADVSNFHVVDITPRMSKVVVDDDDVRYAVAPITLAVAGAALIARRSRRKRR